MLRWLIVAVLGGIGLALGLPVLALTNQPTVTAAGTGPRRALVEWEVPGEVTDGDKTVSTWELDLSTDIDFAEVDTFTYDDAATVEVELTRDDGLVSVQQYYVRVRALYTDDTTSSYGSTYFYTKIPKIKGLRVDQERQPDGVVILKWRKTARHGNTINYKVKLYRKNNVVYSDTVYGKNNITVSGLRLGKRYSFKVRGQQLSTYGKGRWSARKYFRVDS